MKLQSAIRKIEKAGFKLEQSESGQYWVNAEHVSLSFRTQEDWRNSGSRIAINFKITFITAQENDYASNANCYQSYFKTLTKCLNAFKEYTA